MKTPGSSQAWRVILAGFLAVLALIGFWPSPVDKPVQGNLDRFLLVIHLLGAPVWINYSFIEAAANVALFVPLGVLAALAFPGKAWWQIGGLGLLISGFMELGQLLFLSSRFPSAVDLATNTAGSLLGVLLVALHRSRGGDRVR